MPECDFPSPLIKTKLHPPRVATRVVERPRLFERLDGVPSSPNPWSGQIHVADSDRVQRLDLPMTAYIENVERFGQGSTELLRGAGITASNESSCGHEGQ